MKAVRKRSNPPAGGYIREVQFDWDRAPRAAYPFDLPALRELESLELHPGVTFLVGENGSGKSTLIEAIAVAWGFNPEGGSQNFRFGTRDSHSRLADCLTLVKSTDRPGDGFFLRAESFFNVATEIENLDRDGVGPRIIDSYGGRSLHEQSHGESFLALLANRFRGGALYVLDEPEAALSPTRQMAALARIHQLVSLGSQFIIATHSPILMAYPGALIYELSTHGTRPVEYTETEHYLITRQFLGNPERMLSILLAGSTPAE
ncbi:MAG: AAA family ATPase [Armatimonadota bacterium]